MTIRNRKSAFLLLQRMRTRKVSSNGSILHVAAIALAAFLAYAGSFDGEFVSDDIRTIRNNSVIRSLHWSNIKEIFTTFDGANYMPLKVLSLAVDYQLWGFNPAGFHLTNLLLHLSCALVVYALLKRLGMRAEVACLTTLLWTVHPLQVESVAWISERKNVLSTLFFIGAFYVYLRYSERREIRTYFTVLGLFVLALLTKLNTVVLPAICLAYEATFRFRLRGCDVLASLPFIVIGALAAWYNLSDNPIHGAMWHGGSAVVTWISSAGVFFRYLRNFILPTDLQSWYEVPLRGSLSDPAALLSALGLFFIAGGTAWLVYRRRKQAFWVLWFVITLAPMLNILVPTRSLMQDRYMYLPMVGLLGLAASLVDDLARSPAARKRAAAAAWAAIAVCVVMSYRQVSVWSSPLSEWGHGAVRRAWPPIHYPPGDYEAKVAYLQNVLSEDPYAAVARNNLGGLYFTRGRIREALHEFETAVELEPKNPVILYNIGLAHAQLGQLNQAEHAFTRTAALAPYWLAGRLRLARTHLALGNVNAARREFDACERLKPEWRGAFHQERERLRELEARSQQLEQ